MSAQAPGNRRAWTAAIFLSIATIGATLQARGAVLPTLATEFEAPAWQLGLVAPAGTVGYVAVLLAVGASAGRLDAQRFIVGGLVASALALLAMGLSPTLLVFLSAIVVRGASTGVVRALDRPLLSHLYPDERGRVYNRYDMVWAVGAASGPLAVVAAVRAGSWRFAYGAIAVGVLAAAWLFRRLESPAVRTVEEPLTRARARRLLGRPAVVATMLGLFFVTGVEGVLFTWLPYYAGAELPAGLAELTLSVLLVAYVPGRFVSGALAERVGYLALAAALVAALLPAVAYTFLLADGVWVLAGVAAVGLLVSGTFPTLVAHGTEAAPEHSGPVNALASGTGAVAIGTVPAAMGVLIGQTDAASAMPLVVVPLGAALVVLVVAGVAARRRAARPADPSPGDD